MIIQLQVLFQYLPHYQNCIHAIFPRLTAIITSCKNLTPSEPVKNEIKLKVELSYLCLYLSIYTVLTTLKLTLDKISLLIWTVA